MPLHERLTVSKAWPALRDLIAVLRPPIKRHPDEWADDNRVLPKGAAIPGPFVSARTPYMLPIMRAFHDPGYGTVVGVMGSQMGKTDSVLNIIGQRADDAPAPILYVGPSRDFVEDEFEPRFMDMIAGVASLSGKLAGGKKNKKSRKEIAGIQVRFGWAGSATQLAGFPAALAILDERDRMDANVKGEGDPEELVEGRGDTHPDYTKGVFSTPLVGNVTAEYDEEAGLTRWSVEEPEAISSPTWRLWQQSTRHEWAWPCPLCGDYFIPRFELLKWPEGASPAEARRDAWVECPHCGGIIEEEHKADMNARGVAVAPGQHVEPDGTVVGDPPDTDIYGLWVSGLASPWRTFGQRAERFLKAVLSGSQEKIQGVINTGFGELFRLGADEPVAWKEIIEAREPYRFGEMPDGVRVVTAGVDVQSDRLVYVVRGWGVRYESWLLDAGELFGDTRYDEVWTAAADLLVKDFGQFRIRRMMVDSGFRPGKPGLFPTNKIYEFCRRFRPTVCACKGRAELDKPMYMSNIDITINGRVFKGGLQLWHLNTDYLKSWVQQRLDWPEDQPGGFHISIDATEDYCKQLVSEARVVKPSGHSTWVKVRRDNHYLDCEALAHAGAELLKVGLLKEGPPPQGKAPSSGRPAPRSGGGFLGDTRGFLNR